MTNQKSKDQRKEQGIYHRRRKIRLGGFGKKDF